MPIKFRNSRIHYGLGGQVLHWTSVTLLVILIVTANKFEGLQESPDKIDLIMQHASWGLLFLLVMLLRVYWRIMNLNPVHSYSIPDWQKFTAIFLHRMIYFVVITQSLFGLCNLLFAGPGISFFGLFEIPPLINKDELFSETSKSIHYVLSVVIYPLFAIHISAAIYDQLFGVLEHEK
jgi:cytochrome b561